MAKRAAHGGRYIIHDDALDDFRQYKGKQQEQVDMDRLEVHARTLPPTIRSLFPALSVLRVSCGGCAKARARDKEREPTPHPPGAVHPVNGSEFPCFALPAHLPSLEGMLLYGWLTSSSATSSIRF